MKHSFNLEGKVAVITGGGGVLGQAISKSLAAAGVQVGILGRTAAKVVQTTKQINQSGGKAQALIADVLDRARLEAVRLEILNHWGRIDILINAAGGNMPGATIGPHQTIFDLSLDDFDAVNRLNLQGSVLPALVFGKVMAEQKSGAIVNISSMAAQRALTRVVGYSASKAAVDNFTRWLAVEMALKYSEKIRVNAIAPGFFIGDQNRRLLLQEDGAYTERGNTIIQHTPMRRFGNPEELAGAVQWLCSDAASFVTGVVIPVDGGFSAFSGI